MRVRTGTRAQPAAHVEKATGWRQSVFSLQRRDDGGRGRQKTDGGLWCGLFLLAGEAHGILDGNWVQPLLPAFGERVELVDRYVEVRLQMDPHRRKPDPKCNAKEPKPQKFKLPAPKHRRNIMG